MPGLVPKHGKFQLYFSNRVGKTHKEGWIGTQAHQLALSANTTDDQLKNKEIWGRCNHKHAQARLDRKEESGSSPSAGVGWESSGSSLSRIYTNPLLLLSAVEKLLF